MALSMTEQPYQRVLTALRDKLESGALRPGDRYPSVRELTETHSVAAVTARRALQKLQEEGLATSQQGVGWFVTEPPPPAPSLDEQVQQLQARVTYLEGIVERLAADAGLEP